MTHEPNTFTWTGDGHEGDGSDPKNWLDGKMPGSNLHRGQTVVLTDEPNTITNLHPNRDAGPMHVRLADKARIVALAAKCRRKPIDQLTEILDHYEKLLRGTGD